MKIYPIIIALLLITPLSRALEVGHEFGDIVTETGETYTSAKLVRIEPNGISIMHTSGAAKIPYEELPEDIRKKFDYDPAEAEFYEKEKVYQRQIAALKDRIRSLERDLSHARSSAAATAAPEQARQQPTEAGFQRFIQEQKNLSGSRVLKSGKGSRFTDGPWKGKTEGEGLEIARKVWENMSYGEKMKYEEQASWSAKPPSVAQTKGLGNIEYSISSPSTGYLGSARSDEEGVISIRLSDGTLLFISPRN